MTNHKKLFLDDERDPYKVSWVEMPLGPWEVVRSFDTFVGWIEKYGVPSFVSFDHDLGLESMRIAQSNPALLKGNKYDGLKEKTGRHCAVWLVEHCLENGIPIPEYQIHSINPIGAENIRSVMESGKRVQND